MGRMSADLRTTFDEVPQLYDRARPGYPDALITDLGKLAGITSGTRLREIGPGTGQATIVLAQLGAQVVAVELGPGLAETLRWKVAAPEGDLDVEVVVSSFEDWPLPAEPFDVLVAFTAWHWLDPEMRARKAAAALRAGAALVTVTTTHVAGGTESFFVDAQNCYQRWDPTSPIELRLSAVEAVPPALDEIDDSELFEPATRRRYQRDVRYTTSGYLDLLRTYSGHRALPEASQRGLFACIGDLIDGTYGGEVTKRYLYELRLARRRAS